MAKVEVSRECELNAADVSLCYVASWHAWCCVRVTNNALDKNKNCN